MTAFAIEHALPPAVQGLVWRGSELGSAEGPTVGSGWSALDDALPGGGWPLRGVTEILLAQPAILEWRLLSPALCAVTASGHDVVAIGPPRPPCVAGLRQEGLDDRRLVWVRAEQPAERLWAAEQLIRSASAAAVVVWLPHVRAEQIRRLQVCAQGTQALVFVLRDERARREPSAAPLRLSVSLDPDWALIVDVFKRPGPLMDRRLSLPSVPRALQQILTPRLKRPSTLPGGSRWNTHAVGLPAAPSLRRAAANAG